ncbi:alpha/beta hydrolase family protein [Aurantibacter sp.]|uniref:alpha/beta hydrolase family protein n=1 Tax=Aurantibacter sp. TaxID=2807103 RepID=UPI0035C837DB
MINKNQILTRENNKPIVYDLYYNKTSKKKPLVVFCHGYKGFKDWGSWNLVAESFMESDCFFVKFNFSHNGGTVSNPIDFPDLEAFAENNYTKELSDLKDVIDFLLEDNKLFSNEINAQNITLIGHSRGGGIASILASEDNRITKLITWASVCDFEKRTATVGDLDKWKKDGVKYILNGRTKQQMPHNHQFYQDFMANKERLNIKLAVEKLHIPHLIIHAKEDPSVKFNEALNLHKWNPKSELLEIEDSNHVFGAKHPWKKREMPKAINQIMEVSLYFITM